MRKVILLFMVGLAITLSSCVMSDEKIEAHLRPGLDTVLQGETYTDPGAFVLHDALEVEMETSDLVDTSMLGTQIIEYTLTYESVSYTLKRYVKVVSDDSMMFELMPGIDTVSLGGDWIDAGVNADSGVQVTVFSQVDTSVIGTYQVIYEIYYEGNTYHLMRHVHVIDAV